MVESPASATTAASGPVVLCIIDGVGVPDDAAGNAVHSASTPELSSLQANSPATTLIASGETIGLQKNEAGNSAAGHRAMGTGRAVTSLRKKINKEVLNRRIVLNDALERIFTAARYHEQKLHLFGLLSDAGVHSHIEHLYELLDAALFADIPVVVHAFLDGRDTGTHTASEYLSALQHHISGKKAEIGTISGRYYAMDRDGNWDRTYRAFQAIVRSKPSDTAPPTFETGHEALQQFYSQGYRDELIVPTRIGEYGGMKGEWMCDFNTADSLWKWHAEAVGICFNYRADRMRQLSGMLTFSGMPDHITNDLMMEHKKPIHPFQEKCFTNLGYCGDDIDSMFGYRQPLCDDSLGEVLAKHTVAQFRCTESERMHQMYDVLLMVATSSPLTARRANHSSHHDWWTHSMKSRR